MPRVYFARAFLPAIAVAAIAALSGCQTPPPKVAATPASTSAAVSDTVPLSLIPAPYSLQRKPGVFALHDGAEIRVLSDPTNVAAAEWLRDIALRTRGLHLKVESLHSSKPHADSSEVAGIEIGLFKPLPGDDFADEEYSLDVSDKGIRIGTSSDHGGFNAMTTLWQLITLDGKASGPARIPNLHIEDHPRFKWRGLMLDSARHFQPPEYVKQFIDWMALHKYNVLHWHLTDDQGWRIEIKKYPKLTEVGAWRAPAGNPKDADGKPIRTGGYYTQDQIRDIVAYAQRRYVTIVPEIEMPGHAQAPIAAYPQLGVTGKNPGVSHDWGVHTYLYNVEDSTFTFLENVLSETMALFPSTYIHVGGDEAAKDQWQASKRVQQRMRALGVKNEAEMQSWFIKRIEKFLSAHGRKLIGWDEILEGGLPPEATVMSWRGTKGAIEASKQGHDVVLSPDPDLYFDHLSTALAEEPAGRPDPITLKRVYDFNPIPKELDADEAKHVLGAQANLWSEYLTTPASVTRAAYPRAAALAEVLWSPASAHDWQGFLERMAVQIERYRKLDLGSAQTPFAVDIRSDYEAATQQVVIALSNPVEFGEIRYTLDGGEPTPQSTRYLAPFKTPARGEIRATAFERDIALADPRMRKLDAQNQLTRHSSELASCHPGRGLPLKLPGESVLGKVDDAFLLTGDAVFLVDIFEPCWLWKQADLDGIARIDIAAASLPYNFQLWHDSTHVVDREPVKYPAGELQVRLDRCDGEPYAIVPITPLDGSRLQITLSKQTGRHDICVQFATGKHDPLYAIDWMQMTPGP